MNRNERFLELRAQDRSLRSIEKELGVNRRTLAKWDSEYREEIENLKAIEREAMREEYLLTTEAQVTFYGAQRRRILNELEKRDLSEVPTPKLYDILAKQEAQLKLICPEPTISDETTIEVQKVLRRLVSLSADEHGASTASRESPTPGGIPVRAEDLAKLQLNTLQRFQAGDIDARAAKTELAVINALVKSIELTDVQKRLERLEALEQQHEGVTNDVFPQAN